MAKPTAKSKGVGISQTSKNAGLAALVAATTGRAPVRRSKRSQATPADDRITAPPEAARSTALPASKANKSKNSTSANPAGSKNHDGTKKGKAIKAKKASGQTPKPAEKEESTATDLTPAMMTPRGKKRKAGKGTVAPSSVKRILLKVPGSSTAKAESQSVPEQPRPALESDEAVGTAPGAGAASTASAEPPVRDLEAYGTEIKIWLAERIEADILKRAMKECAVPLKAVLEKVPSCAVMLAAERYVKVLKDERYLSEEVVRMEQRNESASLLTHFAFTAHRDEIMTLQGRLDKLRKRIEGTFDYPDW